MEMQTTIAAAPQTKARPRGPALHRESVDGLLITFPAACRMTGLGKSKLYELCGRKVIKSVKVDGARRIVRASLEEWIEKLIAEAA